METRSNDLLLIYHDDNALGYARVEDISPDVKKGWWLLTVMLLQVPAQRATWILREEYIDGEPFFMGGQQMRLERMPRVNQPALVTEEGTGKEPMPRQPGKVIELRPRETRPSADDDDIA